MVGGARRARRRKAEQRAEFPKHISTDTPDPPFDNRKSTIENPMNQSDQMLEFIDGTLGVPQEQELFEQLAVHPELRTELRHYVQIGDAVRADREAFAPPADVERRLLGGLGLLPLGGAAAGTAGAAAGGLFGTSLLKGGLLHLIGGFILGALLAGGGVWYALDRSGDPSDAVAATSRAPERSSMEQTTPPAASSGPVDAGSVRENGVRDEVVRNDRTASPSFRPDPITRTSAIQNRTRRASDQSGGYVAAHAAPDPEGSSNPTRVEEIGSHEAPDVTLSASSPREPE